MLVLIHTLRVWKLQAFRIVPIITPNVGRSTLNPKTGNNGLVINFLFCKGVKSITPAPLEIIASAGWNNLCPELAYMYCTHAVFLRNPKFQLEVVIAAQCLKNLQTVVIRESDCYRFCFRTINFVKIPQAGIIPFHIINQDLYKITYRIRKVKRT